MAEQQEDWIEWAGGECPVPHDARVQVKYRYGGYTKHPGGYRADGFSWGRNHDFISHELDLVAYRVVRS
jgi:hypothetical protein